MTECEKSEFEEAYEQILPLQKKGHTHHCAVRHVYGDGECECNKMDMIPGPLSKIMYKSVCMVCLAGNNEDHEVWCRNRGETK